MRAEECVCVWFTEVSPGHKLTNRDAYGVKK